MWQKRLRSRSSFSKACSVLVRGWEDEHSIPSEIQAQIIEGFCKFYDKRHWKYAFIETAVAVTYQKFTKGSWTFVFHDTKGKSLTVSKQCKPVNILRDIREACRGAVHYDQILPQKTFSESEVDHCNVGGFQRIFEEWIKDQNLERLYNSVVHNDPRHARRERQGFKTFLEPTLTKWRVFHKAHAALEEITCKQHTLRTRKRKRQEYKQKNECKIAKLCRDIAPPRTKTRTVERVPTGKTEVRITFETGGRS